jgi:alkylation response protein AidB-like acyl-CoA dehydrogenase
MEAGAARLAWQDARPARQGEFGRRRSRLYASEAAVDNAAPRPRCTVVRLHERDPGGAVLRDAKVLEIGEGTSEVQRMMTPAISPVTAWL